MKPADMNDLGRAGLDVWAIQDHDVVISEPAVEPTREADEADPKLDPWAEFDHGHLEWFTTTPPPRKWLIELVTGEIRSGVLPRGVLGILASAGGAGKTFALTELALLVAAGGTAMHGCRWLDTFDVAGGRVLYLAAEETTEELHRRFYRVAARWRATWRATDGHLTDAALERAVGNLRAWGLAGRPELALMQSDALQGVSASEAGAALMRRMADREWALVIVDPLARLTAGEVESSQVAATRAVQLLEQFASLPGHPTVLAAHHTSQASRQTGNGDATAIRGVTGLTDAARWCATMTPRRVLDAPVLVDLGFPKHNYSGPIPAVCLSRIDGGALRAATRQEIEAYGRAAEAAKAADKPGKAGPSKGNVAPNKPKLSDIEP